jgi:hypothetical protein
VRSLRLLTLTALLALGTAPAALAQHVYLNINGGAYRQAGDFLTLKNTAKTVDLAAKSTFALGANLELGSIRFTGAYVTGASIGQHGVEGSGKIGEGTLLAGAADVVLRPIPRILVQPYILGGVGFKRNGYSFVSDEFAEEFPELEPTTDLALHWGIGADLMLGGFGVMVEVNDFVTFTNKKFGRHDAFGVVGLRLRLF